MVVDISKNDLTYFMHNNPKKQYKMRIYVSEAGGENSLTKSVGAKATSMLQNEERRTSTVKKRPSKNRQWDEVQTSWVGAAWKEKNPDRGNPSLNEIKEGL